jgi:hypothetical protein
MREEFGDIWEMAERLNSVVCITTNGALNSKRECVMGRGIAKQAKQRYPGIAKLLGGLIRTAGNRVHWIGRDAEKGTWLYSFPTKYHWSKPSSLELIEESAKQLKRYGEVHADLTFYLPRPGCSNGKLRWEDVKPVLESVGLPDNVVVVTNGS